MVVGAQLTAGKCVSFSFEVFLLLLGICFVCSVGCPVAFCSSTVFPAIKFDFSSLVASK
jgi:hypothetical protein